MPVNQLHKSQPDITEFLFCRSLPVVREAGQEKYPVWTPMLDKISLYNVKDKNSAESVGRYGREGSRLLGFVIGFVVPDVSEEGNVLTHRGK
jgi:hypothetical protein